VMKSPRRGLTPRMPSVISSLVNRLPCPVG
jgi:hypothetical protein